MVNESNPHAWVDEFPGAVTVCDREGVILAMNARSRAMFAERGGAALIGTNLLNCHPEPARTRLTEMLASAETNVYTIEKKGIRKLVYQSPWHVEGEYQGFVELVLELPAIMPHFKRD